MSGKAQPHTHRNEEKHMEMKSLISLRLSAIMLTCVMPFTHSLPVQAYDPFFHTQAEPDSCNQEGARFEEWFLTWHHHNPPATEARFYYSASQTGPWTLYTAGLAISRCYWAPFMQKWYRVGWKINGEWSTAGTSPDFVPKEACG